MKFRARGDLLHRIFDERFAGIANFADEWGRSGPGDSARAGATQRSVKTIYAWLKHGLPTSRDTLFQFFGALDVDPIAVLDLDRHDLRRNFGRLRRAFMLGGLNAGGFRPLFDLYRPSATWPDDGLSREYFNRAWTCFEFEHPATDITNVYAAITVRASEPELSWWPRAYHIAYRRRANADGLWRPYGTVVTCSDEAVLIHENGDLQREVVPQRNGHAFRFHTYFGPSPSQFRLASLHAFNGQVEPAPDPAVSLRFIG